MNSCGKCRAYIDTLEAYPTAFRFREDLKDFCERFKRVISRHTATENHELTQELDDLVTLLDKPIKVVVVGEDTSDLKSSVERAEHPEVGLTFIATGMQDLKNDDEFPTSDTMVIKLHKPEISKFSEQLKVPQIDEGNLCQALIKEISLAIEEKIIKAFVKIRDFLKKFIKLKRSSSSNCSNNDKDRFDEVYKKILHLITSYISLKSDPESVIHTNIATSTEDLLSDMYLLPPKVCHSVVSSESVLWFKENGKTVKNYDVSSVSDLKGFREIIKEFVLTLEQNLTFVKKNVKEMKIMIFEVQAYIQRSNFRLTYQEEIIPTTTLPKCLSEELKGSIKSVKSVCTIFGELNIFVSLSCELDDVKQEIDIFLKKKNFNKEYIVIKEYIQQLGRKITCGDSIKVGDKSHWQSATLGCFVIDPYHNVYALTCRHHLDDTKEITSLSGDVCRPLGKRVPTTENQKLDIAAIKVYDSEKENCELLAIDDYGMLKTPVMFTENPEYLCGTIVYKYGAASHLTKGIVSSCMSIPYEMSPFVLISSLPGSEDTPFLLPGDSGSVNFYNNYENPGFVQACSMNIGQLIGGRDDMFVSLILNEGINELSKETGIHFTMPKQSNS